MGGFEQLGLFGLFLGNLLAATVVPFSSDALYIAFLKLTGQPLACLIVATAGNWIGSMISYGMGWLGKLEWIEKWFRVKPETLDRYQQKISKYGPFLGIICWVPIIGDVIAIALGFFKARPGWSAFWILVGKFARFVIWTLMLS